MVDNKEEKKINSQISDSSSQDISPATVQHMISLYNKAIEYYSAMNDERHMEYLNKLQKLLLDEKM